jgi:hypothetical protein
MIRVSMSRRAEMPTDRMAIRYDVLFGLEDEHVSEPERVTEAAKAPVLKRDWRFYAGIAALVLAALMPLVAIAVPLLGLPTAQSAMLAGLLVAGGPEVLSIVAVGLLGKETFQYFTHLAKSTLRRTFIDRPAARAQYYIGLAIVLLSRIPSYIYAYFPNAVPGGNTRIYLLAGMDLAFVASVILMGGEFWEKVRRIFVYEGKF